MGVTKFRTFEEAEQALWNVAPDAEYFAQVRKMFELMERLRSHTFQPGVTKYSSIDEKDRTLSLRNVLP